MRIVRFCMIGQDHPHLGVQLDDESGSIVDLVELNHIHSTIDLIKAGSKGLENVEK